MHGYFDARPRLSLPLVDRRSTHLAGDFGPGQTLAYDLTHCGLKAVTIGQHIAVRILAIVVAPIATWRRVKYI